MLVELAGSGWRQGRILDRIRKKGNLAWSKASQEQRIDALFFASREVERLFNFLGEKVDPDQKLEWPRKGVPKLDGGPPVGVPQAVKDATAFIALAYTAGFKPTSEDRQISAAMITNLLVTLDGLCDATNPLKVDVPF